MPADHFRFGDRALFALEGRLLPDPDGDKSAPTASRGSWGEWQLWVQGRNLCRHDLRLTTGRGGAVRWGACESVIWYLAPLLRWLAENWGALLHERRLPGRSLRQDREADRTARGAYLASLRLMAEDSRAFAPWQDWGKRHSMRRAAEGGLVPDFFLRRIDDDIEISWGNRPQPGGEDARFPLERGEVDVPVAVVGPVLDQVLLWAVAQPALVGQPWFDAFRTTVLARTEATARRSWICWNLDGTPDPGPLTHLFEKVRSHLNRFQEALFGAADPLPFLPVLAPAVAMFGSLSPQISEADAAKLLAIVADRWRPEGTHGPVDDLVAYLPAWRTETPYHQGYDLAESFLEDAAVDLSGDKTGILQILTRLAIDSFDEHLGTEGPRGVALAGTNVAPTIIVNLDHPANRLPKGRHFTLAHEFCHILYDQGSARQVTHASTPWASVAVEQRANAFAAMLLMPRAVVRRRLTAPPDRLSLDELADIANSMEVGVRAFINHLDNIGEIDSVTRDRLITDLDERSEEGNWSAQ